MNTYYVRRNQERVRNQRTFQWILMVGSFLVLVVGSYFVGYEKAKYDINKSVEGFLEAADRAFSEK